MSLLTQYPLWLSIFAVLLGAGYALFLYFRNDNIAFEKRSRIVMASLRGVATALLAFLLLAPMLKMIRKQTDKPVIVLAIDNSESVAAGKDADWYTSEYPEQVRQLVNELRRQYDVDTYLVGDGNVELSMSEHEGRQIDFTDKSTNLSALFDDISLLYANRNVGAVVMLTDGIYNIGSNPLLRRAGHRPSHCRHRPQQGGAEREPRARGGEGAGRQIGGKDRQARRLR